jgi:hypothetical protein
MRLMSHDRPIALVTPSFEPDFERCRLMVDTARRALQGDVTHYLIVPAQDVTLFQPLASAETQIRVQEDLLPPWIQPGDNRMWTSARTGEVDGWHLQQLVKLAAFEAIDPDVALFLDSDNVFLRPADLEATFMRRDRLALNCKIQDPPPHEAWLNQAAMTFGLDPTSVVLANYVDNYVGFWRDVTASMLRFIEERTGTEWQDAFLRDGLQSEYTLYGVYVHNVLGIDRARHFVDGKSRVLPSWGVDLRSEEDVSAFLDRRRAHHLGVMFHSRDDVPLALYDDACRAVLARNLDHDRRIRGGDVLRKGVRRVLTRWPQLRRIPQLLRRLDWTG